MNDRAVLERARAVGLHTQWRDATGKTHRVSSDSLRSLLRVLGEDGVTSKGSALPALVTGEVDQSVRIAPGAPVASLTFEITFEDGKTLTGSASRSETGDLILPAISRSGYHTLSIGRQHTTLAICPRACPTFADIVGGARAWGTSLQTYSLHMKGDGGIGTFGAVAELAKHLAKEGADAVAISPAHAMFAANPAQYSPYSPSSRLFLNALLADPTCIFSRTTLQTALRKHRIAEESLRSLETAPLIDWPKAAHLRMQLLRGLFDDHIRDEPNAGFRAFVAEGGKPLQHHAIFEALHAQESQKGPRGWAWTAWPTALQRADSPEVARFAGTRQADVDFHLFLQWLARTSLQKSQATAREAGMKVGLIADLAVGSDPAGSQTWSSPDQFLIGASIGAPPDALSPPGQDWGLTTFSPQGLRRHGYQTFIGTLRSAMVHGGGVRIDHVMGLERLWVIPQGHPSSEGAYLTYPKQDLMRLVALEAQRHGAVVIGEDLGTVAPSFRRDARRHGIMGMNVLMFERQNTGRFRAPTAWPKTSVSMSGTHDLPTLIGWWSGRDMEWRAELDQFGPGVTLSDAQEDRARSRTQIWDALVKAECAEGDAPPSTPQGGARFAEAALMFVAKSPSPIAIFPYEDLLGLEEQPNLPGTTSGHPNWQQRYPTDRLSPQGRQDMKRRLDAIRAGRNT